MAEERDRRDAEGHLTPSWLAGEVQVDFGGRTSVNRSDGTIAEKCLDNGAHLVAALCHLYGPGCPQWGVNVFPHKKFSATSCPGQIYGSQKAAYIERAQYWYDKMGGKASNASVSKTDTGSSSSSSSYTARVTADALNARKGPGASYAKTGCIRDKGVYTIVEESNSWGRLKSGLGWISLAYTKKTGSAATSASSKKSVDAVAHEVIAGKWGNGAARKSALQKAGYDYAKVQARVNEVLK